MSALARQVGRRVTPLMVESISHPCAAGFPSQARSPCPGARAGRIAARADRQLHDPRRPHHLRAAVHGARLGRPGRSSSSSASDDHPTLPIGESWELVNRLDAQSKVAGSTGPRQTLHHLWRDHRQAISARAACVTPPLGSRCCEAPRRSRDAVRAGPPTRALTSTPVCAREVTAPHSRRPSPTGMTSRRSYIASRSRQVTPCSSPAGGCTRSEEAAASSRSNRARTRPIASTTSIGLDSMGVPANSMSKRRCSRSTSTMSSPRCWRLAPRGRS